MMKIEELVCSKDLANELRDLKIRQDSAFYWRGNELISTQIDMDVYQNNESDVSAFTPTEVAQFYPSELWIEIKEKKYRRKQAQVYFVLQNGIYKVSLMAANDKKNEVYEFHREEDKNEANARAKMLIWLVKNVFNTP